MKRLCYGRTSGSAVMGFKAPPVQPVRSEVFEFQCIKARHAVCLGSYASPPRLSLAAGAGRFFQQPIPNSSLNLKEILSRHVGYDGGSVFLRQVVAATAGF